MKITVIQMEVAFARPGENAARVRELIGRAMGEEPDVILLPEMWNTGFFPREDLRALCDRDGVLARDLIGSLARHYGVNIVAGSVADLRDDTCYNTAYVFDRDGAVVTGYDKMHLFSYAQEDRYFVPGETLGTFELDGVPCGIITCYDLRFPEQVRAMGDIEILFVPSQWPKARLAHLKTLLSARAIENQCFVVNANATGVAREGDEEVIYGGGSAIYDPRGEVLAQADDSNLHADEAIMQDDATTVQMDATTVQMDATTVQMDAATVQMDAAIATADCDLKDLADYRSAFPALRDKRKI